MRTRANKIALVGFVATTTVAALALAMPSRSWVTGGRRPVLPSALAAQADSALAVSALARSDASASPLFGAMDAVSHTSTSGAAHDRTEFPAHAKMVVAEPPAAAVGSAATVMTKDRRTGMANGPPIMTPGGQMVDGTLEPGVAAMVADGLSRPSGQSAPVPPSATGALSGRRGHGRSHFGSLHMEATFHPPLPRSPG